MVSKARYQRRSHWPHSDSTRKYRRLLCPGSNPWRASSIRRMRCLLKPARIQLSTIWRGFDSSTGSLLRAAFFTGTISSMLIPGFGLFRRIHFSPAGWSYSQISERILSQTLRLFHSQQIGLFCEPIGSVYSAFSVAGYRCILSLGRPKSDRASQP